MVSTLVANLKHLADMRDIIITHDVKPLNINGNKTLVEVLITNLITNAIRYNEAGGQITIVTEDSRLTIANTGEPFKIPIEDLYDRFAKGGGHKGTGLGLSIVRKICDTCTYELKYNYCKNMHHFSVVF